MDVSVIISTWNRCALLRQTLDGLTRLRIPDNTSWELVIVNNNCTDETDAVVSEFAGILPVRYLHEPRPGKSNALNAALQFVTSDYLLFTDDDVLVDEDWLAAFVDAAARYPAAAAFGGPIHPWFPVAPDPTLAAAFPKLRRGFATLDYKQQEGPLRSARVQINGANMGLRRAALREARFDVRLGPNRNASTLGEEVELIRRLERSGGAIIWCPAMRVRHYNDPSRMTLPYLLQYYEGYGRTMIRLKGIPSGRRILGAPWVLWRTLLESAGSYVVRRFLRRDRVAALLALRRYRKALGSVRECRTMAANRVAHPGLPGPVDI